MQLLALVTLLTIFPGCYSDLIGPEVVHVTHGTAAHVRCRYDKKYEANVKYWCRVTNRGHCPFLVKTSGSEKPEKVNRVSIRDDHILHHFFITMDNVTTSDAGTYRCGVLVEGGPDLLAFINVTVSSEESDNSELSQDLFPKWDSSSISKLIYDSFLILIGLKTLLLLFLVLAIGWMCSRTPQSSDG